MGTVKIETEPFPGWVPGPNPFGTRRAGDCETWYRRGVGCQFEIRYDFMVEGWVISKALENRGVHHSYARSQWSAFRVVSTDRFADPVGAMLWFELNKVDL